MSQTLKKRGKKSAAPVAAADAVDIEVKEKTTYPPSTKDPEHHYWIALAIVISIAAYLRFRILGWPDKVVF
ncbi:hypothetical protein OXX69_013776, partial [Metschnikowia pulcherrima]